MLYYTNKTLVGQWLVYSGRAVIVVGLNAHQKSQELTIIFVRIDDIVVEYGETMNKDDLVGRYKTCQWRSVEADIPIEGDTTF